MQIILIDIVLNGFFYYTLKILEFILLSPIAIIGLVIEYSRALFVKSKRRLMMRKHKENKSSPKSRKEMSSPSKLFAEDLHRPPYLVIVRVSELLIKEKLP